MYNVFTQNECCLSCNGDVIPPCKCGNTGTLALWIAVLLKIKAKSLSNQGTKMSFGLSDCLKEGRNRLPRCPGQQLFNVKNSSGCWMPVQPGQAPYDHIKVPANVSR